MIPQADSSTLNDRALLAALIGALSVLAAGAIWKLVIVRLAVLLSRPLVSAWYYLLILRLPGRLGLFRWYYRRRLLSTSFAYIDTPLGEHEATFHLAYAPLKVGDTRERYEDDLLALLYLKRRLVLLGGPGSGKTTLARSVVLSCLKDGPLHRLPLLPVFVELRKLGPTETTVIGAASRWLQLQCGLPNVERWLTWLARHGRLLVILDGLDETAANRSTALDSIRNFCQQDDSRKNRNLILVTCRTENYQAEDLHDVIKAKAYVEPFSLAHIYRYLAGCTSTNKHRTALDLYGPISRSDHLRGVCSNPLMLTILVGTFLISREEEFSLPDSRLDFYRDAVEELARRRPGRRNQVQEVDYRHKLDLLSALSYKKLTSFSIGSDSELIEVAELKNEISDVLGSDADPTVCIDELVHLNGLLRSQENGYVFAHRTIQEYFASGHATNLPFQQVCDALIGRPDLREVLAFFVARLSQKDAVDRVFSQLLDKHEWKAAAYCLAHCSMSPSGHIIRALTSLLLGELRVSLDASIIALFLAISRHPGRAFESVRIAAAEWVRRLSKKDLFEALGEAELRASDLAASLIPELLESGDDATRRRVIDVIYEQGTLDGIDRLVQLLIGGARREREHVTSRLMELMDLRPRDVINRASLIPERAPNPVVWPIESAVPSKLALTLIENIPATKFLALKVPPGCPTKISHMLRIGAIARGVGKGYDRRTRAMARAWRSLATIRRVRNTKIVACTIAGALLLTLAWISLITGWDPGINRVIVVPGPRTNLNVESMAMVADCARVLLQTRNAAHATPRSPALEQWLQEAASLRFDAKPLADDPQFLEPAMVSLGKTVSRPFLAASREIQQSMATEGVMDRRYALASAGGASEHVLVYIMIAGGVGLGHIAVVRLRRKRVRSQRMGIAPELRQVLSSRSSIVNGLFALSITGGLLVLIPLLGHWVGWEQPGGGVRIVHLPFHVLSVAATLVIIVGIIPWPGHNIMLDDADWI